MKLSTQEEYGLRCLLQMGRQGEATSLTIAELARLEGLEAHARAAERRLDQ